MEFRWLPLEETEECSGTQTWTDVSSLAEEMHAGELLNAELYIQMDVESLLK